MSGRTIALVSHIPGNVLQGNFRVAVYVDAGASDAQFEALLGAVDLLIYSGTNDNRTAATAHWVLPTAAYLEKDGSFVNCDGRVQRIGRAFPPLAGSREDWAVLLDIARRLDIALPWRTPPELFLAMTEHVAAFEGLSYEAIGSQGKSIRQ